MLTRQLQVQAITESVGETKESPVLRLLLDEALAPARCRKSVNRSEPEPPPPPLEIGEILQTVQNLLLRWIRKNKTGLRAHGISLVLLQASRAIGNRLEAPPLVEVHQRRNLQLVPDDFSAASCFGQRFLEQDQTYTVRS